MNRIKEVNTELVSVKYNKTLKALPLRLYISTAFGESLVTNIALGFTLCYICHLNPVYFIQIVYFNTLLINLIKTASAHDCFERKIKDPLLNRIKEGYSYLVSVKYHKTLKALLLHLYEIYSSL